MSGIICAVLSLLVVLLIIGCFKKDVQDLEGEI
jgi:hypothetical protein